MPPCKPNLPGTSISQSMAWDCSLYPLTRKVSMEWLTHSVFMLKGQVKQCEVTKRRMPISFMIRFVNSLSPSQVAMQGDSVTQKQTYNFIPNFTSTERLSQYWYCYASPAAIKLVEASKCSHSMCRQEIVRHRSPQAAPLLRICKPLMKTLI